MKIRIPVILITSAFIAACSASKKTTTAGSLTYTNEVKMIIDANCANSCHNAARPAGGIDLTTYDHVKEHTLNGKLIPAIQHVEGVQAMPKKNPKLDDASIQKIVEWAAAGAPV